MKVFTDNYNTCTDLFSKTMVQRYLQTCLITLMLLPLSIKAQVTTTIMTTGADMQSVFMFNSTDGWAVGRAGLVYYTSNGGNTWTPHHVPNASYGKVWGLDANNVWAVGSNGTIIKYDGSTWTSQISNADGSLFAIWGANANDLWASGLNASGSEDVLLHYDGTSWTNMGATALSYGSAIWGSDANNVWMVGDGGVLKYNGSTWSHVYSGSNPTSIWGIDANNVWVAGKSGVIAKYDGTSWTAQTSNTTSALASIDGIDANNIWAMEGVTGHFVKYDGSTWTRQATGISLQSTEIDVVDANNIWMTSVTGGIYHYNGSTWTTQKIGITQSTLNSIHGTDANNIWTVGASGTLLKYDGTSWGTQTSGTTSTLSACWAADATHVWAIGNPLAIRFYNGSTWASQSSGGTPFALNGIWGSAANNVYVVGGGGNMRRYNGTSWAAFTSGTTTVLYNIGGIDANNFWVVGAGGLIRYYNGSAWTAQTSGTTNSLQDIWAADASHVWAVGDAGTLLFFDGTTWTTLSSGTTETLYSVHGTAANNVWAVGANGTLLHYNGATWTSYTSVCPATNYEVWALGNDAYISSVNGTVVKATYSGVLPVELVNFSGKYIPPSGGTRGATEGGNLLTWETANEVNNKGFQVERLTVNGEWSTLGFVAAKGKSATYQFIDNQTSVRFQTSPTLNYYRLHQIDNDGTFTYSKVVSIEAPFGGWGRKLSVYPNPVSHLLTVENTEGANFQILNLLGQQVMNGKAPFVSKDSFGGGLGAGLDVSALPQGSYVLKVGTEQVKFIKQ